MNIILIRKNWSEKQIRPLEKENNKKEIVNHHEKLNFQQQEKQNTVNKKTGHPTKLQQFPCACFATLNSVMKSVTEKEFKITALNNNKRKNFTFESNTSRTNALFKLGKNTVKYKFTQAFISKQKLKDQLPTQQEVCM